MQVNSISNYNQQTKKTEMGTKKQAFGMAFKPTKIPEEILVSRINTEKAYDVFNTIKKIAEKRFRSRHLVDVMPTVDKNGELSIVVKLSNKAIAKIWMHRNTLDEVFNPELFTNSGSSPSWKLEDKDLTGVFVGLVAKMVDNVVSRAKAEILNGRKHSISVNIMKSWTPAPKTL